VAHNEHLHPRDPTHVANFRQALVGNSIRRGTELRAGTCGRWRASRSATRSPTMWKTV
jgi:hypothetical protein